MAGRHYAAAVIADNVLDALYKLPDFIIVAANAVTSNVNVFEIKFSTCMHTQIICTGELVDAKGLSKPIART